METAYFFLESITSSENFSSRSYWCFVARNAGSPRRILKGNIKICLQNVGWGACAGLIWLRTGTGGRHF
jgi:hypothetical protein